MNPLKLFLSGSERKKNEASRILSFWHHSAIDLAIDDFPAPAAPYIHIKEAASDDNVQFLILSRTATLVFV